MYHMSKKIRPDIFHTGAHRKLPAQTEPVKIDTTIVSSNQNFKI